MGEALNLGLVAVEHQLDAACRVLQMRKRIFPHRTEKNETCRLG